MSITAAFTTIFTIGRIVGGISSINSAGYPSPVTWSSAYVARGYLEAIKGTERMVGGDTESVVTHRIFLSQALSGGSMSLNETHEAIIHSAFVYSTMKDIPRFLFKIAEHAKGRHWEIDARRNRPSG